MDNDQTDPTHARFRELAAKSGELTGYERGELRAMRDNTRDPEVREAINAMLGHKPGSGGTSGGTYPILEGK